MVEQLVISGDPVQNSTARKEESCLYYICNTLYHDLLSPDTKGFKKMTLPRMHNGNGAISIANVCEVFLIQHRTAIIGYAIDEGIVKPVLCSSWPPN